jgi:hypothetical protein
MSNLRRLPLHALVMSCVALMGCGDRANLVEPDGGEGTVAMAAAKSPSAANAAVLTDGEGAHLIFMRSEEKLARDVYLTLDGMYPEQPVFSRIGTTAEQTHTDRMRDMLLKFGVDDPEPATLPAVLPPTDQIGFFENPYFADYFSDKFQLLKGMAEVGLLEALKVGALIEELDMKDINYCNGVVYEAFGFPAPPPAFCGLTVTDVRALENTLGNLLRGSEHHLCAFVRQIGPINEGCYEAQYLTQEEVWDIIDAQCPRVTDYVCQP